VNRGEVVTPSGIAVGEVAVSIRYANAKRASVRVGD